MSTNNLAQELIGTKCHLVSGGPVMVIVRIDGEGSPVCQWTDAESVEHEQSFPLVCLIRSGE